MVPPIARSHKLIGIEVINLSPEMLEVKGKEIGSGISFKRSVGSEREVGRGTREDSRDSFSPGTSCVDERSLNVE
jgi:hypothetical protein